ncbi:MAG: carbon storage regulator [Oscillospiraceae bacterium]|nr:carbon storage regulator [Oscillospiraceae bacterium]
MQRKAGQSLRIGENITVTIVAVENNRVRIAIDAPTDISILRSELIEAIAANQEAALQDSAASELLALISGKQEGSAPAPRKD